MTNDLTKLIELLNEKQEELQVCQALMAKIEVESRQTPASWNSMYSLVSNYCYNKHKRKNLLSNINQIKQRIQTLEKQ
jgi:hypothetical protein